MPSWTAENEVKLLLTVIKTMNPKIPRATWDEIAVAMGAAYTFESVRQKFQNLKRDSEALDRKPASSEGPKATNSTAAKTKTANKKRKAASPATDDEEDFATPVKARKLKAEKTKVEDEGCVKVKTEAEIEGDEIIDEV